MATNDNPFVLIKPAHKGSIMVNWGVRVLHKKKESGRLACFIPSLNIYFTANDEESSVNKTKALTKVFFDHFFVHSKNGLKGVAIELHKLGYRTPNDAYTIHKLSRNQVIPTKFKINNLPIPAGFDGAYGTMVESDMQIMA